MLNDLLHAMGRRLPILVRLRRFALAAWDAWRPPKNTYSQHGEDLLIGDWLAGVSPDKAIYIDVGANQPTRISNTYLLYRKGFRGIVVEPNREMLALYRRFRPRDMILPVGCAREPGVALFRRARSSVESGFSAELPAAGGEYVPILPLDLIWREAGKSQPVGLLSIDTEGFDYFVLQGAVEVLGHTACLCIEKGESDDAITALVEAKGLELMKDIGCNRIFLNRAVLSQLKG
ncbi:MAG TPA: hypothetical protein DCM68_02605 [Verrucomicrobia bacterium]|nr:hypothetical protein [Verrucomicrobiota bacterium]